MIFRSILVIVFVGVVGTVAAREYTSTTRITTPGGCISPASCGAICAQAPESCVDYCVVNAANAVECGQWAKAYQASGAVEIAQFGGPAPGGMSSGGSAVGAPMGSPNIGAGEPMMGSTPPASGMMSGSPMGSRTEQPATGGQSGMTRSQSESMMSNVPLGRPDMRSGEPVTGTTPPATGFEQLPTGKEFPGQGMMGNQPGVQQGQPQMMSGREMQTCRVDGVERPGRCEEVEKSARKPATGIDLGGGLRGTGPGGCRNPEECQEFCAKADNKKECGGFADKFERPEFKQGNFEDRQSMRQDQGKMGDEMDTDQQERFEQERKRAEERMLQQMKQGMKQMTQMIIQLERRIAGLVRRKVKIPAEVTSAMTELKTLVAKAQNITDPSEMGEIGPQIGELVQTINEQFGDLERLAEFPRVIAQANKMIRQFESQLKRLEAKVNARKLDVGDALTGAKALLEEVKKASDDAKAQAAQGNAEEAFELLQSGIFERGEELQEKMFGLEIVVNAPAQINRANRELRRLESRVRQFERQKKDVAEAKALLTEAKTLFNAIQELVKQRPLPAEELMAQVEEFEGMLDDIRDLLGEDNAPQFKPYELGLPAGLPVAPRAAETAEPVPAL